MKRMNLNGTHTKIVAAILGVACLGGGAWVVADDVDQPAARHREASSRPAEPAPIKLEGTVQFYNFGPMGEIESLNVLTSDGTVQLIMPPVAGDKIAALAPQGSKLQATAAPEPLRGPRGQGGERRGGPEGGPQGQNGGGQGGPGGQDGPPDRGGDAEKPDHKVYRLQSITADGKTVELAVKASEAHVEGTIKHLNYDRGGRIDGAIMDSGELVIFAPSASSDLKLEAGQKLTADGMARQLPTGQTVLAAKTVNGMAVPQIQQRGGPGQRGPGDDQGSRGGRQDGGPQGDDRGGPPQGGPDGDRGPRGGGPPIPGPDNMPRD